MFGTGNKNVIVMNKPTFYLFLVTAIWGVTFPLTHNAVKYIDPFLFVFLRFSLGALLLLPVVWNTLKQSKYQLLKGSIILGIINSAAYTTQTIGLQTVSSARVAFITGLCVILVPFLMPIFKLGNPKSLEISCALICFCGIYILTGADISNISIGDIWSLLCAILFAIAITYLQYLSLKLKNHKPLAFYQILFTAPIPLLFTSNTNYHSLLYPSVIIAVLFCAMFATSIALYLQAKYQHQTTAPKAVLIYSLEPVFAGLFGFLFNGEAITKNVVLGGLLIMLSLTLSPLLQLQRRKLKT